MPRDFDVVLYGATGFTGRQTVRYFADYAPQGLRWAIAGRNAAKLEGIGASVPAIAADSSDQPAIDAMVQRTRVLLTTAGPFAQYGNGLVDACVRFGTHYVDITGETTWVRSLIDRYHTRAAAEGTRIIPFCGFDSVPSDLGAACVANQLEAPSEVKAYFRIRGGAPNGGTIASALNMAESGMVDSMRDLFLLSPGFQRAARDLEHDPTSAFYDAEADAWVAPCVMSTVNTRVVRRSCSITGVDFAYQEYMKCSGPMTAKLIAGGGSVFEKLMKSAAGRRMLRAMTPKPGAGPSEKAMDSGWFRCELAGRGAGGRIARAVVEGKGDPANRVTVKCLCESALALACDGGQLPQRAGVLTPSTGIGEVLVDRLRARGISIGLV